MGDVSVIFFVVQVKLREMKPGTLSKELKEALGMPEGAPPPWLINMQVKSCYTLLSLTFSLESHYPISCDRDMDHLHHTHTSKFLG